MKHTPGPWKVSAGTANFYIRDGNHKFIAKLHDDLQSHANSKLIVTSPELLTECDAMHAVLMDLLQSDIHTQVVESLGGKGVELSEVYRTILKAKGE